LCRLQTMLRIARRTMRPAGGLVLRDACLRTLLRMRDKAAYDAARPEHDPENAWPHLDSEVGTGFATNAERVCAEIVLKTKRSNQRASASRPSTSRWASM